MHTRRHAIGLGAAFAVGGLAPAWAKPRSNERGPGKGPWRSASPADHGLDAIKLDLAAEQIGAAGERQGLVLIRHGRLVYERYWANAYHRAEPTWRNVSFSSGKSWGSAMVGRAYTDGLLKLDDPVARYWPSKASGLKPATTIRHLLTMSSGGTLNVKPSSRPPRRLDDPAPAGSGVEYAWQAVGEKGSPPGYGVSIEPGTTFYYDGAAADHLANVVAAASGVTSHDFMMRRLIEPLGCEAFNYQPEGLDKAGNVRLGGSIQLSCRDMARLGQLFLDRGLWAGKQLIAADYIDQALSPSALNPAYGFLWWFNGTGRVAGAPRAMSFAAGALGQFCFVLPEQDMVVATMGFGQPPATADSLWAALAGVLPG